MNEHSIEFKKNILDTKSPSFCGAKWYNATMWLDKGWTASCHHNPPHVIDIESIKSNPAALHNTPIKKNERRMMQQGEKPLNCQFCWVMEETAPDRVSDRVWMSQMSSPERLETAYNQSYTEDYDLDYLEIAFDRTCNLGCSYCSPSISSTWARDIRANGAYPVLVTDERSHYKDPGDRAVLFKYNEENPYVDAFLKWWDQSLHKSLKLLRITGGEPMMSGHTWKLLEWLASHPNKSTATIHMTTNLVYDHDTLQRFLDYAEKITQPIILYTSTETIGKKAEYIRDGFDWDLWQTNLNTVLASKAIKSIGICGTLGTPSVDGFVEFLEWLLDRKKQLTRGNLELSVNPIRFPSFQNVIVLPIEMRLEHSRKITEFLSRADSQEWLTAFEYDQIDRFAEYLKKVEAPHRENNGISYTDKKFTEAEKTFNTLDMARDFKKFFAEYDQRRNKDFAGTFPNLVDWYNTL